MDRIREQRSGVGPSANRGYTVPWLLNILIKNGIPNYSKDQITRHVRGDCACQKLNQAGANAS